MEMPITKPSMVSYADELDFPKLMEDLAKEGKNGFIRVTSRSEEGYILFKAGKQVAASYNNYAKSEALEKIASSLETPNTLIEVFDVGPAQVDYLLDLNKPFKIEAGSNVYDVIGELRKTSTETPEEPQPEVEVSKIKVPEVKGSEVKGPEVNVEPITDEVKDEPSEEKVVESPVVDEVVPDEKPVTSEKGPVKQSESLEASLGMEKAEKSPSEEKVVESPVVDEKSETSEPGESESPETSTEDAETEEVPADRSELLKKYGIKDVEEEQIEGLLQTYKGGIIEDDDVEKVELVLMNLIKKSVLGIPKIKGTEVMVFLDNYKEITGTINIIVEYETQGFINRIMGQSKTANNLRRQIISIAEIAIKKSFRQYPEVVDKFKINVEFS